MKYLVIIYGNQALWNSFEPDDMRKAIADQDAFNKKFHDTGELLGAYGLADAVQANWSASRGRPAGGDRRPVPGDQGVPRQLLPRRLREPRAGARRSPRRCPFAALDAVEVWPIMHEARADDVTVEPRTIEDLLRDARAAGPRRAGAPLRPLRRRRGRRAGGAARGRARSGRERAAGQPARLADHRRLPPADRPAPQRRRPAAAARTRRVAHAAADAARHRGRRRARRHDDDSLTLLFLCCHPALSPASQIALTLRAVGGLTTAEIARAFLVPEATMAQRISRAKQRITRRRVRRSSLPPEPSGPSGCGAVLHVLYLIFNEGYTATLRAPTCTAPS